MAISAPPEPTGTAPTRTLFGLTDAELVAAVRRGSDRAFEQLYARYHRRIAAYVHGMVGDHGRAEDIAQEVFISALRRMRETERPIAFKPWIYEIAKNACIDQFRRARRSEEVSIDADDGLGAADYGRLAGSGPAPDVAVDQKMAIDHLRGAFGGLSETHHEILVMRELEGLSYAEIGDRLGMTRPSVESTLFRARRRLGEEYEELVSGVRCLRVQDIIDAAGAALPGARDQRRLSAHLSHCQPCRRHARVAGLDATLLVTAPRRVRTRIAALLPLPAFLRRRWVEEDVTPAVANHHVSSVAQLSAQLSTAVDPAIASWAKAVAAAATLALAGAAGGAAVDERARGDGARPAATPERERVAAPAAPARRAATPALAPAASPAPAARPDPRTPAAAPAATAPSVASTSTPAVAGGSAPAAGPAGTPPTATAAAPALPTAPLAAAIDPTRRPTANGRPGSAPAPVLPSPAGVTQGTEDALATVAGATTKTQLEDAAGGASQAVREAAEGVTGALAGG